MNNITQNDITQNDIKVGQTIIMNDGSQFVITAIKATTKNRQLNITLKPVNKIQNRYNTTWSNLKKLLQVNMLTIMQK